MTQTVTIHKIVALLSMLMISQTNAFSVGPAPRQKLSSIRLNAWSIPSMPSDMSMFTAQQLPNLDTSWYTVSNPAPRIVYDDVPVDYTLMSAGMNWPSMDVGETATQAQQQHRSGPLTPLRRAARWARKIRR